MRIILSLALCLCFGWTVIAQHAKVPIGDPSKATNTIAASAIQQALAMGEFIPREAVTPSWWVNADRKRIGHDVPDPAALIALKAKKTLEKKQGNFRADKPEPSEPSIANPVVGNNFRGNVYHGFFPLDNTMAISNDGDIVSVINSSVAYFSSTGSALIPAQSLAVFFAALTPTATVFDPRVIYDSQSDRFILVALHGSSPANSRVYVAFSQSSDPTLGWWVYSLAGDAATSTRWFDYPSIGLTDEDLVISGNMFSGGGQFQSALVLQMNKAAGYAGQTLNFLFYDNVLDGASNSGFTVVPVSHGREGNYGPGMYLVSSGSGGANYVTLYDISDNMSGNPNISAIPFTVPNYAPGGDAVQSGSSNDLDIGDSRVQDAFYLDGTVHMVFHSDRGTGWNGINYKRLNVQGITATTRMFGLDNFDYVYPSLASFSNSDQDPDVMIGFLRSGNSIFPEIRVVNSDKDMFYSSSVTVKAGTAPIDIQGGLERWGDYTATVRRHSDGAIWMSGCYGTDQPGGSDDVYDTWIAEINGIVSGITPAADIQKASISPNPARQSFDIQFDVREPGWMVVDILDMNGRLIQRTLEDHAGAGPWQMRVEAAEVESGTYFVVVRLDQEIVAHEKLVILQ